MTRVHSFDVFDTLITRKTATPYGVFVLMQHRLQRRADAGAAPFPSSIVSRFPELRVKAERKARDAARPSEIAIDRIYDVLAASCELNEEITARLLAIELELEEEVVAPVPENIRHLHQLAAEGKRVILVSDMYLSLDTVLSLLDKAGVALPPGTPLYLSSEVGKTKAGGALFEHVLREEGINAGEMIHVGDNRRSDRLVPERLGIGTKYYAGAELRPWEEFGRDDGDVRWQLIAGHCRCRRLSYHSRHRTFGYSLAGPALTPYVVWVLDRARESGVKRLYFIARDGQILQRIAERLEVVAGEHAIDCRYIYGSRQAWHLASLREMGEREMKWPFTSFQHLTPAKVAVRLGVSVDTLVAAVKDTSGMSLPADMPLRQRHVRAIRRSLRNNAGLRSEIIERAQGQRKLLLAYLEQEGLRDDIPYALVDLGWAGNLQDSLYLVMGEELRPEYLLGFYFGLHRDTPLTGDDNRKVALALSPSKSNRERYGITWTTNFMELFAAADHGSTIGYRREANGTVVPVLDAQGDRIREWGISDMQEGIMDYVEDVMSVAETMQVPEVLSSYRKPFMKDLAKHVHTRLPCREMAECLGSFPFTPEQEGDNLTELGCPLSAGQAFRYLFRNSSGRSRMCMWPQAGAVRSSAVVKCVLHPRVRATFDILLLRDLRFLSVLFPEPLMKFLRRNMPDCVMRFLEYRLYGRLVNAKEKE
jgi:predicted HAD superfamily hydrolase